MAKSICVAVLNQSESQEAEESYGQCMIINVDDV